MFIAVVVVVLVVVIITTIVIKINTKRLVRITTILFTNRTDNVNKNSNTTKW